MIHFFTIVLNGEPFIRQHLAMFESLPMDWHWHIVEGIANLTHDTAWSKPLGGVIQPWMHKRGLSVDGTTEYLNSIRANDRITIYRKPSKKLWDGKLEMVTAAISNIRENGLLWEVDVDEFWTRTQIQDMADLFDMNPERQSAQFHCIFFVGPDLYIANEEVYGNHAAQEWKRVWRFQPGDQWQKHEPPQLMRGKQDVSELAPFTHDETKLHGLVFQHAAYVIEWQLRFKEAYYGYKGAVAAWKALQGFPSFPSRLGDFLPWVTDGAMVARVSEAGIKPIFKL